MHLDNFWLSNICGTCPLHVQNLRDRLEVGANYCGSVLYAGIFMHRLVAASVSKETPYLSGWWSSPPAVAAPRRAGPPLPLPPPADPAAPWSPRWYTNNRLNLWSTLASINHNDKHSCFAIGSSVTLFTHVLDGANVSKRGCRKM